MKKEFKSTGVGAVDAALYAHEKRVEDGTENSGCFIQRQYPQIDPNYKLTIEDAIAMYTKSAQEHPELKDMHTQVAEWLKELVELRKKIKPRKKKTVYTVHHVYQHDFDIEHRLVYKGSDAEQAFAKCYEYFENIVKDTRKDYEYPFDDEHYKENENKKFTGLEIKALFIDKIRNAIDTKAGLTYSSRDDYLWDKEADGEEGGFELNVVEV